MSFDTFGLHRTLLRAVQTLGYTDPTPIQQAAIPAILSGRDVIGCAQTGTGKTAAYLLPVLHRFLQKPTPGPRALIVLPTRELSVQVDVQRRELASRTAIRGAAIHGGVPFAPQAHALRANVDVVAATPGRLLDHLARHSTWCDRVQVLVLDEADRMLDMGFLPDLRRILSYFPQQRQTLLLSATIPPAIAALAEEMLDDPLTVAVGSQSTPPARLAHTVYPVSPPHKTALLMALLATACSGRCPGVHTHETPCRSPDTHPGRRGISRRLSPWRSHAASAPAGLGRFSSWHVSNSGGHRPCSPWPGYRAYFPCGQL